MTIGIYSIFWLEQDLYYVGQSSKIESRILDHERRMQQGLHSNYKVQAAYNSFGRPEFQILQVCTLQELNTYEEFWQNEFNSLSSLDIVKAGIAHSQGITNPRAKYSKMQLLKTFRLCRDAYLTSKQISILTLVSISMVEDIRSGRAHKWLQEKYPFCWSLIDDRRNVRRVNGYKYSAKKLNKEFIFISPTGEELVVNNFSKFAKEYNLDSSDVSMVASGKYKHTKGFRLK